MSNCIRESLNAAKPHSYGESFSADGRLGPSRLPITIRAMPMPVATKRNSRVGRYSASTLASRSEEHTSELQSLMRISYAVFCLKNKKKTTTRHMITKQRLHKYITQLHTL